MYIYTLGINFLKFIFKLKTVCKKKELLFRKVLPLQNLHPEVSNFASNFAQMEVKLAFDAQLRNF